MFQSRIDGMVVGGIDMPKRIAGVCALSAMAVGMSAYAQDPPSPAPNPAYLDYADLEDAATLPDGRRIQMVCMGQGSPTVILTAGLGEWGASWSTVQKPIAEHTRVCSWDRPGWGFSDASDIVQTNETTTDDLEAALAANRIDGPYVMVGHSLGAFESMIFTDRHLDQVAGFVSVDGSIPDQFAAMRAGAPLTSAAMAKYLSDGVTVLNKCVSDLRAGRVAIGTPDPDGCLKFPPDYPPELAVVLANLDSDGRRPATVASLVENFSTSAARLANPARSYGDMPLIVLTAGRSESPPDTPREVVEEGPLMTALWRRGHEQVAALSSRGVNRIVPEAGHYIHEDQPDVVIAAVLEVIEAARSDQAPRSMPAP